MYEDLLVAKEGATFDMNGQPVFVNVGDIVRVGHPVLRGHEYLFQPLVVKWDLPRPAVPPAVEPAEERRVPQRPPASPVKASHQGARSRA